MAGQRQFDAHTQAAGLLDAAVAVLEQWDSSNWKLTIPTAELMSKLREAVAAAKVPDLQSPTTASNLGQDLLSEIHRLRPHYQSGSMLDHGRRQLLDHFEEWTRRQPTPVSSSGGIEMVPTTRESMVERVARAIVLQIKETDGQDESDDWKNWTNEARAAIEAMRDPTEAMLEAAFSRDWRLDTSLGRECAQYLHSAMIDAALDSRAPDPTPAPSLEGVE